MSDVVFRTASQEAEKLAAEILTPQQALELYDQLVSDVRSGRRAEALSRLSSLSQPSLEVLVRELGVPLGKKRPSRKPVTDAVVGRISESVMISSHTNITKPARAS